MTNPNITTPYKGLRNNDEVVRCRLSMILVFDWRSWRCRSTFPTMSLTSSLLIFAVLTTLVDGNSSQILTGSKNSSAPYQQSHNIQLKHSACRFFLWDIASACRYHVCKHLLKDCTYEGLGGEKVSVGFNESCTWSTPFGTFTFCSIVCANETRVVTWILVSTLETWSK